MAFTLSSAAFVDDHPDAPDPAAPKLTWVHWLVYNIRVAASGIAEDHRKHGLPPAPPWGAMTGNAQTTVGRAHLSAGTAVFTSHTRSIASSRDSGNRATRIPLAVDGGRWIRVAKSNLNGNLRIASWTRRPEPDTDDR